MHSFLKKVIIFLEIYKDVISSVGTIITILIAIYTIFFTNIPNNIAEVLDKDINLKKIEIIKLKNEKLELKFSIKDIERKLEIANNEKKLIENKIYNDYLNNYFIFLDKELDLINEKNMALYNYKKTLDFIDKNSYYINQKTGMPISVYQIKKEKGVYLENEEEIVLELVRNIYFQLVNINSYINSCKKNLSCNDIKLLMKPNYKTSVDYLIKKNEIINLDYFLKNSFEKYSHNLEYNIKESIRKDIFKNLSLIELSFVLHETTSLKKEYPELIVKKGIELENNVKIIKNKLRYLNKDLLKKID